MLSKTLESPLDSEEIKPVNSKGNQPWVFIGRTDAEAEAEAPMLWPPDAKSKLNGKNPDVSLYENSCPEKGPSFFPVGIGCSEKAMAPHSSTLAWKIPWAEEPGRLQSMRLLRVRHDWATSLLLFTFMHWRRKWQPTPVFLPGESQGQESLVGWCLWGHTESDTAEVT